MSIDRTRCTPKPCGTKYNGPRFSHLQVTIRAIGCQNSCRHCAISAKGKRFTTNMPAERILNTFDWLAQICTRRANINAFVYEDPFDHPDIEEIIEGLWKLNIRRLIDHWPTHGSGIAAWEDPVRRLKALRDYGVKSFQFTFHGDEDEHDWFVGRDGAYRQALKAAKLCVQSGYSIYWSIMLNKRNLGMIEGLVKGLKKISDDQTMHVGITLPLSVGHGSQMAKLLPSITEYDALRERLPDLLSERRTETFWADRAAAGDVGIIPRLRRSFAMVRIERDGSIWHDFGDHEVCLGTVQDRFEDIVGNYLLVPSLIHDIRVGSSVESLRHLAENFSDRDSEIAHSGFSSVMAWYARYKKVLAGVD